MDAFFAAIEERDSPQFSGLPIIIGADPKNGFGRGVVSTANYVARKYGIRSAMPISWAYRACPNAIFLPCDFKKYGQVSQTIMSIIRSFGYVMEQVSVDEAYMEITGDGALSVEELAEEVKQKVWQSEKLTCSIGIGPNKLVAKIASDFKKPAGLTIVEQKQVQRFLDPMPVRVLPGVGPKTGHTLLQKGILTIKDLRHTYPHNLKETFGKHGMHLWEMAHGRDDRAVEERHEVKSVGRQSTFERDTNDPKVMYESVLEMLKDTFRELKQLDLQGKTVTICVRYAWFETHTSQESTRLPLDFNAARKIALKLLMPYFNRKMVRLVGVRVSGFKQNNSEEERQDLYKKSPVRATGI